MADAVDLHDDALWVGGYYELAIELGEHDDRRLDQALRALWRAAAVEGCWGVTGRRPSSYAVAQCTLSELRQYGQLAGVVRLPKGQRAVCAVAMRERSVAAWVTFFIPVGALERAEPRSAAFPFRGGDSLLWRRPLDRWLADIGRRVFQVAPFQLGLIGHDVTGLSSASALNGEPPEERWAGYLIPAAGELAYHQADR